MADLNMWVGIGRLGRDPELRRFANGDAVCNVAIAVGKKWKDKASGEMREQTTWVPCSFFGRTAELLAEYAHKGSQIRVTGEFSVRKYTDKDGAEKYATEIRVSDLQFLGARPDGAGGGGTQAPQQQRQAAPAQQQRAQGGFDDDSDVPF